MLLHAVIHPPGFLFIGSIEALRPVFMIVMGAFLLLIAWRMSQRTGGYAGKMLRIGSVLLAFGYAIITPLYETKTIIPLSQVGKVAGDPAIALAWHVIRMIAMNGGWVLTGTALAIHARLFETTRVRVTRPVKAASPAPLHETAA